MQVTSTIFKRITLRKPVAKYGLSSKGYHLGTSKFLNQVTMKPTVRNYWWFQGASQKSNFSALSSSDSSTSVLTASQQDSATSKQRSTADLEASNPHEFVYPLTFGEPHEIIQGGHVPDSMIHINLIQMFLENLHDLGLPWWVSICSVTICFRLLVLPLNISLVKNSARLNVIRKDLEAQGAIMSDAKADEIEKVAAADKYEKLLKEHKCHPFYNIIPPFIMSPMFLSVFLAVERICLHDPSCKGGGALWFLDLGSIDPTFMLPVLSAATWLLTIELGAAEPRTEFMRQIRSITRFAASVMVPVTAALPSGVFVYWITSNIFSLLQIYLLQRAPIRRILNIPPRTEDQYIASNKPITI
jgi:YidC/Oxa1 family membrane protein insertase